MRSAWSLPDDVTYLNHGSFGPSPRVVQEANRDWSARLESEPMDFFVRQMEHHLDEAADRLGRFIGANGKDLIFVDNATFGMNIVATSIALKPDDEVLVTDHEYGAVLRIWQHTCKQTSAKVVVKSLPFPMNSDDEIVSALMDGVSEQTKLIVVSHVTSPTAVILPVEKICRAAKKIGIPVCIDGPHAVAMIPLNLKQLGCDYYAASCHKWLSAPFGSGFLYVAPRRQQNLKPVMISWGGSLSGRPKNWKDEFTWSGTRDPAAFLAIPAAIDFLEEYGFQKFREQTHSLAHYARQRITELTGTEAFVPDSPDWYGSMITLPIPASGDPSPEGGKRDPLQDILWDEYKIEVPVIHWKGRRFVRISCHLYNTEEEIDRLVNTMKEQFE
ncbi:MAG: aminotransferase class V-fold PLP-dependent enzyme [Planctomycetes bacterium]|nr:aminotransferase class V-fold PLP-dependent enzyme [Planctomycetota bacterium]